MDSVSDSPESYSSTDSMQQGGLPKQNPSNQDISSASAGVEMKKYDLTGTVVMLGAENAFIRLSDEKNTIYSIGINADTKITQEGKAFDIGTLEPRAKVVITALDLPNTEKYDFLAQSIDVAVPPVLTVEERTAELLKTGTTKSFSF